jgi:predicted DNA-binding transcriptional regulator AlpA
MSQANLSGLNGFDELPTSAYVRLPIVAALFSISASTVWRWSRTGLLPAPVRMGHTTLWKVEDLRRALAGSLRG